MLGPELEIEIKLEKQNFGGNFCVGSELAKFLSTSMFMKTYLRGSLAPSSQTMVK